MRGYSRSSYEVLLQATSAQHSLSFPAEGAAYLSWTAKLFRAIGGQEPDAGIRLVAVGFESHSLTILSINTALAKACQFKEYQVCLVLGLRMREKLFQQAPQKSLLTTGI